MKFRISKYDPQYRNNRGSYMRDDWTSVSDFGKSDAAVLNADIRAAAHGAG
jgi:hypothetical protein